MPSLPAMENEQNIITPDFICIGFFMWYDPECSPQVSMPPFESTQYTTSQIRKAGNKLKKMLDLSPEERSEALEVLRNFRALHYAPLNTFQATLRDRLDRLGSEDSIVAQRIKRLPTILDKLRRYPNMNLDRMQDIGGIRTTRTTRVKSNEAKMKRPAK